MKTGISTACFYPHINTEDTLEIIEELGFDMCETFLESDCEITYDYACRLNERAEKTGIKVYSVHAFAASFEPFLFDLYPRRRHEMEKRFKDVCKAANILGAKCYTFHGLRKNGAFLDIKKVSEGMDNLCKISAEYNVKIAWENVAWCNTRDPEFIKNVLEGMKEDIYFTLDIKQAIRSGRSPMEYLDVYQNKILNLHINDADQKHSCLLPGQGTVNLKEIIGKVESLNKDVPYIIEVYNDNFGSIEELKAAKNYVDNLM
jgi:sugar phosphate isomerase/epimerase